MCYRPVNVKQADGRFQKVKCGHCLECLAEKRNAWVIRMDEELKTHHHKGVFFTLTYSDDNVPKNFLVYEKSFTDTPKLYESVSDYAYETPAGFRGRPSYKQPVDSVLQAFYHDYTITDGNIDNNYKKYKQDYETIIKELQLEPTEDTYDSWNVIDPVGSFEQDTDCSYLNGSVTHTGGYNPYLDFDDYDTINDFNTYPQRGPAEETFQPYDQGAADGATDNNLNDPDVLNAGQDTPDGPRGTIKPALVLSFNSVRQKDLQDWLKRGRAALKKKGLNFTYFITSEYGPRTLRPHYHGCLFGVNKDDVREMFNDWKTHFGTRIKYDNINSTAGCGYCAKYCAKGFYEHPLCSRDFFYTKSKPVETGCYSLDQLMNTLEFTEYHSKHYERCMEFFRIDKPIVTPTFRLVSKGLGIDYTTRMQDYFRLGELENETKISILKNSSDYDARFNSTMEEIKRYFHYTNEKGFTFPMPDYYSKKMFSDNLRHAFANYVRSQYDRLYYEQLIQLQAADPSREATEILSQLEEEQRRTKIHKLSQKLESIEKYYNKSKL